MNPKKYSIQQICLLSQTKECKYKPQLFSLKEYAFMTRNNPVRDFMMPGHLGSSYLA